MDSFDRDMLKSSLRRNLDGAIQEAFLEWNSDSIWKIQGIKLPIPFFQTVATILPTDSNLYFEGINISYEAAVLYGKYRAHEHACIGQDTLCPQPDIFHVKFDKGFIDELIVLAERLRSETLFHHFKAYNQEALLLWFHDAFDGGALDLSSQIPEESIKLFTQKLGATYTLERVPDRCRAIAQFQNFLTFLEANENKRKPWWKRIFGK